MDFLSSPTSKSYVAGSTNTLFLSQRDLVDYGDPSRQKGRFCDVIINLDEPTLGSKITILDNTLRSSLSLSAADRRWIDHLTQTVLDTWNSNDPSRPTTHAYQGSEDAIRLSFEEYVLSLLSSVAYKEQVDKNPDSHPLHKRDFSHNTSLPDTTETANDFNNEFLSQWQTTPNYSLWHSLTVNSSPGLPDIIEPRHPTAGGLNIEDVQRRVGAAVAELHLDERVRQGRETAGKAFEAGRERVGAGVARFWKEVEGFKERREASRGRLPETTEAKKEASDLSEDSGVIVEHDDVFDAGRKSAESKSQTASSATNTTHQKENTATTSNTDGGGWAAALRSRAANVQRPNVDTAQVQAAARENAAKAGAYLSSWGSWARDKSKEWQDSRQATDQTSAGSATTPTHQERPESQRHVSAGAVAAARSAMDPTEKPLPSTK